ncbi:hypothetical protein IFM89_025292, partial [Coptis chinensis]
MLSERKIISSLCFCWRSKTESSNNVEVFLENYGCLGLQRYKYSEVKKMTNSFKDTLGKGGYGCVFKGHLRDGRLVAVKVFLVATAKVESSEIESVHRRQTLNCFLLWGYSRDVHGDAEEFALVSKCASFRRHAERAFKFSRNQMQDSREVALGLMKELSRVRSLLAKSID